ncbi:rCG36226, partial [Rattus norvegicus]
MKILDKKVQKVSISNKLISSLCCPNTPRQLYNGLHDRQKARRYPHRPSHYGEPAAMAEADKMARLSEPSSATVSNHFALPGFSLENPQIHFVYIYCMIILGLSTNEN